MRHRDFREVHLSLVVDAAEAVAILRAARTRREDAEWDAAAPRSHDQDRAATIGDGT